MADMPLTDGRRLDLTERIQSNLAEHARLFDRLRSLSAQIEHASGLIAHCLRHGNKVLLCGNGGSAADAEHFAAELAGRFLHDRPALAAVSLTGSGPLLTCIGNDYGFEHVFARQVSAIGVRGDCLVAISTSGRSANVALATQTARRLGLLTIGMTGETGGLLHEACDLVISVPHRDTARIQEAHGFIVHTLCQLIEMQLNMGSS